MSLQDFFRRINPFKNTALSGGVNPLEETVYLDEDGKTLEYPLLSRFFLATIIILVSALSFGIGRLSVVGNREPIQIEYDAAISNQASIINASINIENSISSVVASKNGSKYHYPHCAGAKQIKEENKISFNSPTAAEAAGYELATNCLAR